MQHHGEQNLQKGVPDIGDNHVERGDYVRKLDKSTLRSDQKKTSEKKKNTGSSMQSKPKSSRKNDPMGSSKKQKGTSNDSKQHHDSREFQPAGRVTAKIQQFNSIGDKNKKEVTHREKSRHIQQRSSPAGDPQGRFYNDENYRNIDFKQVPQQNRHSPNGRTQPSDQYSHERDLPPKYNSAFSQQTGLLQQFNVGYGRETGVLPQHNVGYGREAGVSQQHNVGYGQETRVSQQHNVGYGQETGLSQQHDVGYGQDTGVSQQHNVGYGQDTGVSQQHNVGYGQDTGVLHQRGYGQDTGVSQQHNVGYGQDTGVSQQHNVVYGQETGLSPQHHVQGPLPHRHATYGQGRGVLAQHMHSIPYGQGRGMVPGHMRYSQERGMSPNHNGIHGNDLLQSHASDQMPSGQWKSVDQDPNLMLGKQDPRPAERLAVSMKKISKQLPKSPEDKGPDCYELPVVQVKYDKSRKLAIKCVGQPCHSPTGGEKVLMVVGATGAGKTTLVNGIVNYIYGVEWEDNFRFKLITEEGSGSQVHSQTKWITAYKIHWNPQFPFPYNLTVIDTPGFGDTRGIQADKELVSQIKELFSISPSEQGITLIHGIGFVTQASLARLTPPQRYVFDSILSIFGRDISENVFLMTTFADGQKPPVIEAARVAKVPIQGVFKFNNSALFASTKEDGNGPTSSPGPGDNDEDNFDKMFWKMGFKSFERFFTHLKDVESKSLQLTKEVLKERQELETILNGLQPQIRYGLQKLAELELEKRIMEKYEAEIAANKNFTYVVEIEKMVKHPTQTGIHTTNCLRCNFTCHLGCRIPQDKDKHKCWAMDDSGKCRICPQKCQWDSHFNNPYYFETETVSETRTLEDLKKKYHDATSGKSQKKTMMENIKKDLQDLQKQVLAMICQAQRSLKRLDEIALKPNPLSEVDYLDLLIQSEEFQAQKGWQDRVRALQVFKQQAELLAKMREKGTSSNDSMIDSMIDENWWKAWLVREPPKVATDEEVAQSRNENNQGWRHAIGSGLVAVGNFVKGGH